jgi:hypothetical protein
MDLIVEPPVSVGPLAIDMPILDAERLLYTIEGAVVPTPGGYRNPGFVHFESEMSIQVEPDRGGRLRSVQIYRPSSGVRVLYGQVSLFETPADELIRILAADVRLEIEDDGLFVVAPELFMSFVRDMLDDGSVDARGRYFESVLVAKPGYGDRYERAVWPSGEVGASKVDDVRVVDDGQGSLF